MEHKRPNYVHISTLYRRTNVHMPDSQQWEVFGNTVLYSFIQKSAAVRFFEYAANSAAGERLRRGGGRNLALARRNRWHYSTEWKLRFIQNVASCYVLCLKTRAKESVNTAWSMRPCVCVCVCATHAIRRSEWYTKWRRVRIEFPPSPDPDQSPDFEKRCPI